VLWWVNFDRLRDAYHTSLSLLFFSRTWGENNMKRLMGQDKTLRLLTKYKERQSKQTFSQAQLHVYLHASKWHRRMGVGVAVSP